MSKLIKKYLDPNSTLLTNLLAFDIYEGFPDWWNEAKANLGSSNENHLFDYLTDLPLNYDEIINAPIPETKALPSHTPIKDAASRVWNNIKNTVVNAPVLPAVTGSTNLLGTNTYKSTVGDELKVAGAGAATIGVPAALNYAYNYPVSVASDLLYGTGGTWLGGKIGNWLGKPIDYLIGNYYASEGLGYLGNIVGGGFGLNAANNFRKRAIETIMRTSPVERPNFSTIHRDFKWMPLRRKLDIANYVLTGYKRGPKGYYNSFASGWGLSENPLQRRYNYYTGLFNDHRLVGNDMIDAYLYGKLLDPAIATLLSDDAYHPFMDYIAKNYPDRKIPIYLSVANDAVLGKTNITSSWVPNVGSELGISGGAFGKTNNPIDVSGHLVLKGVVGETPVYRGADIWKFNPSDYIKRWLKKDVPYYLRFGLNEVDKVGTPVISLTPWIQLNMSFRPFLL